MMLFVKRFQELKTKSSLTSAEQSELQNLTNLLRDKIFTPEDFNKLQDCITNMEVFIKDNVDGYLQQKQQEFDAEIQKFSYKGQYNSTITYQMWNTVTYNHETFISKQNNNLNHTPNGNEGDLWWSKLHKAQGIRYRSCFSGEYNNATSLHPQCSKL